MTGEGIGFAMERLFEAGARDVYTVAVGMKKNRPGTLIRVLCAPEDREAMAALLFKHTSTLGVRENPVKRYILNREIAARRTPYGTVSVKEASGSGVTKRKYEYEDIARIARENGLSLNEALALIEQEED